MVATSLKHVQALQCSKIRTAWEGLLGRNKQIRKYLWAFLHVDSVAAFCIVCSSAPLPRKGQAELGKGTAKDIRDD